MRRGIMWRRSKERSLRSEEGRVGEEGRSRGGADHLKKKKKKLMVARTVEDMTVKKHSDHFHDILCDRGHLATFTSSCLVVESCCTRELSHINGCLGVVTDTYYAR